jgi:ATP-dependent Clp protease ATP-binding subunit ClpA
MESKITRYIQYARRLAHYYGYIEVSPYWLLHAGVSSDDRVIATTYEEREITVESLRQLVDYTSSGLMPLENIGGTRGEDNFSMEQMSDSEEMVEIIKLFKAYVEAGMCEGVPWELLAMALGNGAVPPGGIAFLGTTPKTLAQALASRADTFRIHGLSMPPSAPKIVPLKKTKSQPTIEKYCKELSKMAEEGNLDPIIGRSKEIGRIVQILGRRRKNNPVILGPAGTGKTAIAEGIALDIFNKEEKVKNLWGKRIVSLDLHLMLSGTKYRGMFEERLTALIQELEDDPDTIVFIDEIHTIVGAGDSEGSTNDASNMLKPALARGNVQVIGATTKSEYSYIKQDPALERRFQPVELHHLTENELLGILKGIKEIYEKFHKVTYSTQTLKACVVESRKLVGRNSPDVEIDLLDESGSRNKGSNVTPAMVREVAKEFGRSLQAPKQVGFNKK